MTALLYFQREGRKHDEKPATMSTKIQVANEEEKSCTLLKHIHFCEDTNIQFKYSTKHNSNIRLMPRIKWTHDYT